MNIKNKIKGHLKCVLWSLAWWVLDDTIRKHYISRSHFNEYTQWMSRDFPIMEDMYEHFKRPYGLVSFIDTHRNAMHLKHISKHDNASK